MKLKASDIWFSRAIRIRSDWACEACGKQYLQNAQGLHCSHHFSRRHRATRWATDNASAHCFSCHQRLGGNPVEFARWIRAKLGDGALEILEEKKNSIVKISKAEEKEIAAHYRKEFNRIQKLRDEGVTGWIEVESWQ